MSYGRKTSRGGAVLIGALVIDAVGNGLLMPLSLQYFDRLTPVPLVTLGLVLSIANLITLPLPIWTGSLADRIGALPLVIGAQVLQGLGFLAYPFVAEPVGIFAATALVAIGVRIFWSAIFTAVADYVDGVARENPTGKPAMSKDSWFAWANMARTAGLGIGGLATGIVVADGRSVAYHGIAVAAAFCFFAAAATIAIFVRTPPLNHPVDQPHGGYRTLMRDRPFLALTGLNTIWATTSMMLGFTLSTYVLVAVRGPAWLISTLLVGNMVLISVLAAPVVRRLAPFRRTRVLMVAGAMWTAWSLALAVIGPMPAGWLALLLGLATLLFTAAETLHAPVSMGLASATAPVALRGRYLAVFQYSFTIGGIVAPTFFTALFELDHSYPWLALALVNAASVGALVLLERRLPAHTLRDRRTNDSDSPATATTEPR